MGLMDSIIKGLKDAAENIDKQAVYQVKGRSATSQHRLRKHMNRQWERFQNLPKPTIPGRIIMMPPPRLI